MSDGNFNRALLPSTPYASGLKAGRAQARQWAQEAFDEWLRTAWPDAEEAILQVQRDDFRKRLTAKGV